MDSDEPLMLPLEAIELDDFRRRHGGDTFWCGLLLGGCGLQLTTKLYTDRVCHFAHHPGPDGHPHVCGRRARGVSSADHLYVKSAAAAWLHHRGERADFEFTQLDGVPIGSVVDIQLPHHRLRMHLDHAVPPVWDDESEPVLGLSVPVDRDTLIERWYVHRIRLDSRGTTRQVRIGTEAFARTTEWFGLEDCEITSRGLSTPAVQQIIQAHSTPSAPKWTPGKIQDSEQDIRAQELIRKLLYARRTESIALAQSACDETTGLTGVSPRVQEKMNAAVRHGRLWIEKQTAERRQLFASLDQAVADRHHRKVRTLLTRVKAATKDDDLEPENRVIAAATEYLAADTTARREYLNALLDDLDRLPRYTDPDLFRMKVHELLHAAKGVDIGSPKRQAQIETWRKRAPAEPGQDRRRRDQGSGKGRRLYRQVASRDQLKRSCPRCGVGSGVPCLADTTADEAQGVPHDERMRPIIEERKERQRAERPWRVYEVTCPDCGQGAEARCTTSGGPHRSRVELAKEFTRRRKPHPASGGQL
ncbi:zinc finger domain-containing protein [Streptomyces sp. NPDC002746]